MNRSNDSSRTVAELRDELLGFTHPSAVRRIASAVRSVSSMVLTTESLVADLPEKAAPAAPAAPDMGGMY